MSNLQISEPFNRAVYQRDNTGSAFIPIVGVATVGTANVTATFNRVKVGAVQTLEYQIPTAKTIPVNLDGSFSGRVVVPGGWYSLTISDGNSSVTIDRVGAGEVFVLFGHSFISGGHDKTHQLPATDERVCTLVDRLDKVENKFSQLTKPIGPFGDWPDAWGMLGDKLVAKLNVPVLFYGAAYGGSNIKMSYEVLNHLERTQLPPGLSDKTSRQPLLPLEVVMDKYVSKTGVRAVLVEHGYNDRGSSADQFQTMFKNVFDYVRTNWKKPKLALMLVQEQLTVFPNVQTLTDPITAQGIKNLIATYADTFKGVDFNETYWPEQFRNHDHLYGTAIDVFAADWDKAINSDFLARSTPYLSESAAGSITLSNSSDGTFSIAGVTLKAVDWVVVIGMAVLLLFYFIKKSKGLIIGFLLLLAFSLGRLTNKV